VNKLKITQPTLQWDR